MNANGSAITKLTQTLRDDGSPTWSLDGSKIAFEGDLAGGNSEVYVMNANGTGVTALTKNPDFDGYPAWRP